ncbi:MAG TPA: ATP-binding protein [Vicinamibacteria bacterium]|nr:ATP-binding protein [Vicinamibacteria bacterium]
MSIRLLTVRIRQEQDVVAARQRARQLARLLGFDEQGQVRIATSVSELARNVYNYAREGEVEFTIEGQTPPQVLVVRVSDKGPGIADVNLILSGRYRSSTGMGLGILGARRLMDRFAIQSSGQGTAITIQKLLPAGSPLLHSRDIGRLTEALAREGLQNPLAEVQQQNQELLHVLDDLRRRQEDLVHLNRELEDTNRGVVALYAELDEKAEHLRRADEMKSRFLSNMSHEFRTPLNSILAISKLLHDRTDGDLTPEQEKQVGFVRKAAQDLTELVNDLLDLAKVEAGKTVVRPVEFEVKNLFGALRGMLRPLLVTDAVRLVFEDEKLPEMYSDEAKISQILRNFISNALKFTERGEIRVSAAVSEDGRTVVFSVADTGIGIAPEDMERIFSEFGQVENRLQRKFKGTGLGLALSRKLAELLGGGITVESDVGRGSTFHLTLPLFYGGLAPAEHLAPSTTAELDPARIPILVVEDSTESLHVYERLLRGTPFQVVPARTIKEAEYRRTTLPVRAVVLDIQLAGEDTWAYLARLKSQGEPLPVLVVTSTDDQPKAASLGADAYASKPVEREWLVRQLRELTGTTAAHAVLIDDEEAPRYALRALLGPLGFEVTEYAEPEEALRQVLARPPDVLLMDLIMPGMTGLAVLERLRQDPRTRTLPALIITSKVIVPAERDAAARLGAVVLSKDILGQPQAADEMREGLRQAGWRAEAPPSSPLHSIERT